MNLFIKMSTIEIQNRYTFEDSQLKGNILILNNYEHSSKNNSTHQMEMA